MPQVVVLPDGMQVMTLLAALHSEAGTFRHGDRGAGGAAANEELQTSIRLATSFCKLL